MNQLFQKYLAHSESRFQEIDYNDSPELIVIIPAINEPDIFKTYESLLKAQTSSKVLVLTVVNYSEKASDLTKIFNRELFQLISEWGYKNETTNIKFRTLLTPDVRRKHAGAGYARKVGMDTATEIFSLNNNEKGLIVSLDADCLVAENYFEAMINERAFDLQVLNFDHQKDELSGDQLKAMLDYEIYLHYYVLVNRMAGFPYAYHTIGSCFALTVDAYMKNGGMNKKHAGEDFYFLHKLFPNCNVKRNYDTLVKPSGRVSDRVPFGTGPALNKILEEKEPYTVYNPNAFEDLRLLFDSFFGGFEQRDSYNIERLGDGLQEFLISNDFKEKYREAAQNSGNQLTFTKRLFQHFNAFQIVKYLNFVHEKGYYDKVPVLDACKSLFDEKVDGVITKMEVLVKLKKLEQQINLRQLV